jgi:Cu-Zn family superoxide dismutase
MPFASAAPVATYSTRRTQVKFLVCAAVALFAFSGSVQAQQSAAHASSKPVVVTIKNAEGQVVGTATLSPAPTGVKIALDIKKLPPGEHSIHIHQFAKCDPPDFKSAGAHFDGGAGHDHMHGGTPAGDIPDFSLIVAKDGTAKVTTIAPNVTMGDDDHSVFSNGGTAIVIHAVAASTTGAAPPRIACGEITRP